MTMRMTATVTMTMTIMACLLVEARPWCMAPPLGWRRGSSRLATRASHHVHGATCTSATRAGANEGGELELELEMEEGEEEDDGGDWAGVFGDELGDDVAAAMLEEMGFDLASLVGDVGDSDGHGCHSRDESPPRIAWAESTARWLWDAPELTRVMNSEGWPLIHLPGMVSAATMEEVVLPLCEELEGTAEKVEQVGRSSRVG